MSPKLCRCHGVVMLREPRQWRCPVRARVQNRRAATKYRHSAKGRARHAANNARRIYVGHSDFLGRAETPEQAQAIQRYARAQYADFQMRVHVT